MNSINKFFIYMLLCVAYVLSCYFLFKFGMSVHYEVQKELLDNIRDVSAIIFGVCGAWLALSYPKAVSLSSEASSHISTSENRERALEKSKSEIAVLILFVKSMFACTIILLATLLIPYFKIIAASSPELSEYIKYLRGANLAFLFSMALLQSIIMLKTIKASILSLSEIYANLSRARFLNDLNDQD